VTILFNIDFSQFLTHSMKLYETDVAIYRLQVMHTIFHLQLTDGTIGLGFGFRVRSRF